ncbi:hypothetical protein WLV67_25025, partial [Bordetella bronchiseptica]
SAPAPAQASRRGAISSAMMAGRPARRTNGGKNGSQSCQPTSASPEAPAAPCDGGEAIVGARAVLLLTASVDGAHAP